MTVNMLNCSFIKNYAEETGGAISVFYENKYSLVIAEKCLFEFNRVGGIGGAIFL